MYKHLFCTECRALYLIAKGRRSMFGGGFHKEILRPLIQFLRIWFPHAHCIEPSIYHGIFLKSVWNLYQHLIFFQVASIGGFSRSFCSWLSDAIVWYSSKTSLNNSTSFVNKERSFLSSLKILSWCSMLGLNCSLGSCFILALQES